MEQRTDHPSDHHVRADPKAISPGGAQTVEGWRYQLVNIMAGLGALLGPIVYIPSVWAAWTYGHMGVIVVDTLALAGVCVVYFFRNLGFKTRAILFCSILYMLGAWLLIDVGAVSQIYLLGFSIITALLIGFRTGLVATLLNGITLFSLGYLGHAAPEMAVAMLGESVRAWFVITMNFLLINTILVVMVSFVVNKLESALGVEKAVRQRLEATHENLVQEMAARAETQRVLEQFKDDQQEMMSALQEAVWMTDLEAEKVIYVSPAYEALTGYPCESLYEDRMSFQHFVHEADQDRLLAAFPKRKDGDFQAEFRIYHPEKGVRWLWTRSTLCKQGEHQGLRLVGVMTDITDRKQAELALADSEERFQLAVDGSGAGIWDWKISEHVFFVSPRFEALLGYAPGSLHLSWDDLPAFVHPEDANLVRISIEEHLNKDVSYEIEFRLKKKNGQYGWFRARGRSLKNAQGEAVRIAGSLIDVTREHQYIAALQEREKLYRELFDQNPHCMWVYHKDSLKFLAVNEATLSHYGYSREAFLSMTLYDLHPSELRSELRGVLNQGIYYKAKRRVWPQQKANGEIIDVEVTAHETRFEEKPACLVLANDITEKLAIEKALQQSEERLKDAQQLARLGYWDRDLVSNELVWSDSLYKIFDVTKENFALSFDTFVERTHPKDQAAVSRTVRNAIANRSGFSQTYRIIRSDGVGIIHEVGQVKCDHQGFPIRIFGSAQDITERWRAQEALRVSEERFRGAIDNAPFPAVVFSEEGRFIAVNKAWREISGYGKEKLRTVDDWLQVAYTPKSAELVRAQIAPLFEGQGRKHNGEIKIRTANGEIRIWDFYSTSLGADLDGQALVLTMAIDITVERRAREALTASEERFRVVAEVSNDAIWDRHLDSDHIYWSNGFTKLFGYECHELYTPVTLWQENIHPEDKARVEASLTSALESSTEKWEMEYRFLHADRSIKFVNDRGVIFRDGNGKPLRMIGGMSDITARKIAENSLNALNVELEARVAQRTEDLQIANKELEAFSYSVSHDLRAPLRAIDGFSRVILEDYMDQLSAEAIRYFDLICSNAQQMGQLIDDLLAFSRLGKHTLSEQEVAMDDVLNESIQALTADLEHRDITFHRQDLGRVQVDPILFRQVWINLVGNAVKYTRNKAAASIEIGVDYSPEQEQIFWVRDNGVGFDDRYVHKLFTPFQRLHRAEDYEGTGIGLAIVQRIVERHGGRVWAEGKLDQGATFYFSLPRGAIK